MAAQWRALCAAFRRDDTALVLHGRNHYALIFALRERTPAAGEAACVEGGAGGDDAPGAAVVCELLTAKKGQRPAVWLTWREARALLLSWDGHAVLSVTRT